MLDEILQAVAAALYGAYGDKAEIFRDEIRQGLRPPCFFLGVLQPDITPLLGRRSLYRCPLDIQYFPPDPQSPGPSYAVAEELAGLLRFISLPDGSKLQGRGINFELEDGVLHFFVTYALTLLRPADPVPAMETLETKILTRKE